MVHSRTMTIRVTEWRIAKIYKEVVKFSSKIDSIKWMEGLSLMLFAFILFVYICLVIGHEGFLIP